VSAFELAMQRLRQKEKANVDEHPLNGAQKTAEREILGLPDGWGERSSFKADPLDPAPRPS